MPPAEQISQLQHAGRQLLVDWADGHHSVFHAIWLRDNCACPECRHPSGQRLLNTTTVPADIAPATVSAPPGGAVEIVWANDGHRTTYTPAWLRAHCYADSERAKRRPRPSLWDSEMQGRLPEPTHAAIASDETALRDWLAAIEAYGFAILRGVPVEPGEVTRVVELFGYVRETNYGRLFDVKSVVNPNNLAYTGLALGAATPTIPIATPRPACNCCTACRPAPAAARTPWSMAFAWPKPCAPRAPPSMTCSRASPCAFGSRMRTPT